MDVLSPLGTPVHLGNLSQRDAYAREPTCYGQALSSSPSVNLADQ